MNSRTAVRSAACSLAVQPRAVVVHADHDVLDAVHRGVGIATRSGWSDPAEAGVVVVIVAPAVAVLAIAEALPTNRAVDGAVEVVAVLLGSLASSPVGIKDGVDTFEGCDVPDRVMPTRSLDPVSRHHAGVVVVAQDAVDRVRATRRDGLAGVERVRSPAS